MNGEMLSVKLSQTFEFGKGVEQMSQGAQRPAMDRF